LGSMKKSIFHLIIMFIGIFSASQAWADDPWREPVTPLPGVSPDKVRLAEGVLYCYAGYGTQQSIIKIEGLTAQSDKISNPYIPGLNALAATFLRFGCKTDFLFMDFSTLNDSMRLDENVTYQGETYNSIKFRYRVTAVGTSFSVLPHKLYLDLGLGYTLIDYHLGLYGNQYSSQYESETTSSNNLLLRTSLRYIINHYVMIHWQHEKAIDKESIIQYSNQLGLNFLARF
jgi:hypothetical protein